MMNPNTKEKTAYIVTIEITEQETAKEIFLMGLGGEFISIRNLPTLPSEFQTLDIDDLTTAAHQHLARVQSNRQVQRQQQQMMRQSDPQPPPTSGDTPSNTNNDRGNQNRGG